MGLPANICIGTYDGSVAGMTLDEDAEDTALTLTTTFAYNAHPSAIRACALHAQTLATGGADEVVRVYDLKRRQEVGSMQHHSGTISALEFADDARHTLLFCGARDASISVWRRASAPATGKGKGRGKAGTEWSLLKGLAAHRSPVAALAVHPSLRVLLSTSEDRALYLWNLARGKVAFSVKTKVAHAHAVAWAPDGERYVLAAGSSATVSDVSGAREVSSCAHGSRVGVARFLQGGTGAGTAGGHTLLTGADDGVVRQWDLRAPPQRKMRKGGKAGGTDGDEQADKGEPDEGAVAVFKLNTRVVDVHAVDNLVVAADARGALKIWDVRRSGEPRIETAFGTRGVSLTCMSAAPQTYTPSALAVAAAEAEEAETEAEAQSNEQAAGEGGKKNARALEGTASQRKRKKSKLRK